MCLWLLFRRCGVLARLSAFKIKPCWYGGEKSNKQSSECGVCVWRVCVRVQRTLLIRGAPGSSANCTETCSHVESTPQAKKAFCVRFLANKTHNKEGAEKRASVSDKDQQTPSEVSFLFLWPLSTQKGLWLKTGLIFFGCQMIHLVE